MRASGFGLSHVGRVRQRNEDCVHVDSEGRFAILADGMGGHRGGQEASRMTVDSVREALESAFERGILSDATCETEVREFLRGAFKDVAGQVAERGRTHPELDNMGTTLVCWLLAGGRTHVAHVGDSRAYVLRRGSLFQVTMDHVLGSEHVRQGFPREQAERIPMRHVLVRNIGSFPPSEPDIVSAPLERGDHWILCSDGLSNKLSHTDLAELLALHASEPAEACRILVEEAWHRGGEDNISVVILELLP